MEYLYGKVFLIFSYDLLYFLLLSFVDFIQDKANNIMGFDRVKYELYPTSPYFQRVNQGMEPVE
jgi:hypothetical protein